MVRLHGDGMGYLEIGQIFRAPLPLGLGLTCRLESTATGLAELARVAMQVNVPVAEGLPGCLAAWLHGCLAAWLPGCLCACTPIHMHA